MSIVEERATDKVYSRHADEHGRRDEYRRVDGTDYYVQILSASEKRRTGAKDPSTRVLKVTNAEEDLWFSDISVVRFEDREEEFEEPQVITESVEDDEGNPVEVTRTVMVRKSRTMKVEVPTTVKTPWIGQLRIPLAGKVFDLARFQLELQAYSKIPSEQAFPELGIYCQRLDCWSQILEGRSYCSNACETAVKQSRWRNIEL